MTHKEMKILASKQQYLKKYYREHKTDLQRKMKEYKLIHKDELAQHNRMKYEKEREKWLGDIPKITKDISKNAETLAKSILRHEGFKEIIQFTQQSVFDYFAKKNGRLCGIDVSTAMRKPIRPQQVQMAHYFSLDVYLLFIKPDLIKYKLIKIPHLYLKRKRIHYKSVSIHTLKDFKEMHIEIIRLDIDSSLLGLWKDDWLKAQRAVFEYYGYYLKESIIRESGQPLPWENQEVSPTKGKGYHIWHHILTPRPLLDMEKLELQFMLGSDYGRCWINYLRITQRNNPAWDKIFGYVTWRSPPEEPCKSCRLRKYLEEIAKCPREKMQNVL